jgi:hypothetical protein
MENLNMPDCETPNRPYLVGENREQRRAVLFRPACGLWSCPVCAQANKARWTVRAYNGSKELIAAGREVDFLTLTSHEKLSPESTRRVFAHAWDQLNKRIRREVPGFAYLLVPEQHKDGRLHAHLIETSHLSKRWYKDNARECGLGYEVDIDGIRSPEGAAWYVAKYVGKGLESTAWPRGFRRVRTSRNWPPMPILPPLIGWTWRALGRKESLDETYSRYEQSDFHIVILGSNSAWEYVTDGVVDGRTV